MPHDEPPAATLVDSIDEPVSRPGGLALSLTSYARLAAGGIGMAIGVVIFFVAMVPFLPWRSKRVRISNYYGSTFGRFMFWCSGSTVVVTGHEEALARGPAIWAMNHSSLLDIPLGIWLSPQGTVGVGKKQVIYYPLFGLLYVLAGHLRIDRRQTASAVASMKKMATWVREDGLSIFIWPEGTRSRDGRLTRVKKGIVHLALQTGLPIQPMVTAGTHRAWPKGPPRVVPTTVHIHYPAPIDTTGWSADDVEGALAEIEAAFIDELPSDQQPLQPLR